MNDQVTATVMVSGLVPRTHVERLHELAREHDRSFSAELRRAVREHLQREQEETQR